MNEYSKFYNSIKKTYIKLKNNYRNVAINKGFLNNFFKSFKTTYRRWRSYLKKNGRIPFHVGLAEEILYLGLLDSDYTSGSNGKSSPFGPWLSPLQKIGKKGISIKRAFEQQQRLTLEVGHLVNAQKFANEIYAYFLNFVKNAGIIGLKPGYNHPPIIQLCSGGTATLFKDFSVPAIIVMDGVKNSTLSDFSAIPHEIGHVICGAFQNSTLIKEITKKAESLPIEHIDYWKCWIEECFADAIAVSILKEGEIFSLRNLLSRYETNVIHKDRRSKKVAVHPMPHVRVLLTIEVGRILGLEYNLLNRTKAGWIDFSIEKNNHSRHARFDQIEHLMSDFDDPSVVELVAKALIDTPYKALNNRRVKDIFLGFNSKLALAMKYCTCKNKKTFP